MNTEHDDVIKAYLSLCKRHAFTLQKVAFHNVKGMLLYDKRGNFIT